MKFLHKLLIGTFFIFTIYILGQDKYKEPKIICSTYNIVPLRVNSVNVPRNECYYLKDTNNELSAYEGTWKASWSNRTIYVYIKKLVKHYEWTSEYYADNLIIRFKTIDNDGNILYDNTNLSDDDTKIQGLSFGKADDRYSFVYIDPDLCLTSGNVRINFIDSTKTKLDWNYFQDKYEIDSDCFFYNYTPDQLPNPLPKEAILVKQ